MKEKGKLTFARLLFSLIFLIAFTPFGQSPALASASVGTIAYVVPNTPNGDEIHLIESDGTGSRLLYRTNNPIPENLSNILTLAWKPDGSELAFIGAQEYTCSLYETDIYAIHPDGKNYRRVTDPPACGSRADLPTGTVTVPVSNDSGKMGPFIIYIQGAPAAKSIALAPGDSIDVTFYNVADYGQQEQFAVWMYMDARSSYAGAKVDVVPGAAVRTGKLVISTGFANWGFRWPTYLPDGSRIASIFSEFTMYEFDANDQGLGWNGVPIEFDLKLGASRLAWGPTPALADQFLYYGAWQDSELTIYDSVFLGNVNYSEGQELFDVDPNQDGNVILGLAWLPDGSGFLYSLKEIINDARDEGANIWEFSFDTGKSHRLTEVPFGFTREMSVSPDGSKIVFEYQASGDWIDANPPIDLYMMNRNGSGLARFVKNGRSPAWSPASIPGMNPVPALAGLNPATTGAGGPDFTLTVNGSNFVKASVVRWGGADLPTTYGSATTLTASITAAQIASVGPVSVTVFNPAPGGGESQALTLSIVNSKPALSSLEPGLVAAGGPGFTLTINGNGFSSQSVARWNGANLATTYASPTRLTAQVPSGRIAAASKASVTVNNPAPGGGESQPLTITISKELYSSYLPIVMH